jgi:hypothetical protein
MGEGPIEHDAPGGQSIDLRSLKILVAVAAQPVRPKGVDTYQEYIFLSILSSFYSG